MVLEVSTTSVSQNVSWKSPSSLMWFTWKSIPGIQEIPALKNKTFSGSTSNFGGVCLFSAASRNHFHVLFAYAVASLAGPSSDLPGHTSDPNWSCFRHTLTAISTFSPGQISAESTQLHIGVLYYPSHVLSPSLYGMILILLVVKGILGGRAPDKKRISHIFIISLPKKI